MQSSLSPGLSVIDLKIRMSSGATVLRVIPPRTHLTTEREAMPSESLSFLQTRSLNRSTLLPVPSSRMPDRFILSYPAPGRVDSKPMRIRAPLEYSSADLTTRSRSLVWSLPPRYIIAPPPIMYRSTSPSTFSAISSRSLSI